MMPTGSSLKKALRRSSHPVTSYSWSLKPYHTGQIERKKVISRITSYLQRVERSDENHLSGLVVCEDNGTDVQESQEISQIGRHVMLTISYQLTISPPWLSGWMNLLVHR